MDGSIVQLFHGELWHTMPRGRPHQRKSAAPSATGCRHGCEWRNTLRFSALLPPLRRRAQQLIKLILVELSVAGGEMAARRLARRDEVELAVLQLLQSVRHETGFRRVALVIGRVDHQNRG